MKEDTTRIPAIVAVDGDFRWDLRDERLMARNFKTVSHVSPDVLRLAGGDGITLPLSSYYGATPGDPWRKALDGGPWDRTLSAAEVRERLAEIEKIVTGVRRAGAGKVISQICDQTIFGNSEKRYVFWEFYDRWGEYAEFGYGDKPEDDPIKWLQQGPDGQVRYNYPKDFFGLIETGIGWRFPWLQPAAKGPIYRYASCVNNEHWIRFLEVVMANMAHCGFDGTMVDNNIQHCYCPQCEKKFKAYLQERFSPEELRDNFGTDDPGELRLNRSGNEALWAQGQEEFVPFIRRVMSEEEILVKLGARRLNEETMAEAGVLLWKLVRPFKAYLKSQYSDGELEKRYGTADLSRIGLTRREDRLLWSETQRFWARSVGVLLGRLKKAGERFRREFIMVPNFGSHLSCTREEGWALRGGTSVETAERRRRVGHILDVWADNADYVMFEENVLPSAASRGELAEGVKWFITDYRLNYKLARACKTRCLLLPGASGHSYYSVNLEMAEAAASGGGAFELPYGLWVYPEAINRYREFFAQKKDLYEGLVSEAHTALVFFEDSPIKEDHLKFVFHVERDLSARHVPYDLLTEQTVTVENLDKYRVVILGAIEHLDKNQMAALSEYERRGGFIATCGVTGWPSELGKTVSSADEVVNLLEEWGEKSGRPLSVAPGYVSPMRFDIYREQEKDGRYLVLHAVNYDTPTSAREITIDCEIPAGWEIRSVRCHSPYRVEVLPLPFQTGGGRLRFVIPEVETYEAVEIAASAL